MNGADLFNEIVRDGSEVLADNAAEVRAYSDHHEVSRADRDAQVLVEVLNDVNTATVLLRGIQQAVDCAADVAEPGRRLSLRDIVRHLGNALREIEEMR